MLTYTWIVMIVKMLIHSILIIADDSVIALANRCHHLRSLGLYYCQNITDRAMYSLAHSRVNNKTTMWEPMKGMNEEEGLRTLNISQCTALTPPAVQAVCDSFPSLHTCSGRHSLIMSGCLNLMSVHCACAVQAHRTSTTFLHPAHWTKVWDKKSTGAVMKGPKKSISPLYVCMY